MHDGAGNNFNGIRLTSVDGTSVQVMGDSLSDYVLHPVFLRFLALSILIYACAAQRPDLRGLGGWGLALVWTAVAGTVLGWLALWSQVLSRMIRKRIIAQVFTPVILVPMVPLTEMVLQSVTLLLGAGEWLSLTQTLQNIARDMIVVNLFDMIHSHFVAFAHPLVRARPDTVTVPKAEPSAPLPVAQPAPDDSGPVPREPAMPEFATTRDDGLRVQIGPVLLPLASILVVRTEDHYLGVTTRSGKALHRAKMADIPELHTGLAGMQINRSVWIAYSAIREVIETDTRQVVVTLVTGDEERVSKPRLFAFRQSYSKYLATTA